MALKLYHSPYSTCSQKVRLVLHEKELAFESIEISFRKQEHLTAQYLKLNPNGVLPTLLHNGNPIIDSSCIIEYLDEVFPARSLSPPDALGRANMRAWMRFCEEVPTAAVRTPSFEQIFLPSLRVIQGKKKFDKAAQQRTLRKGFYESMNSGKGFEEKDVVESVRGLSQTAARMHDALADSQWILGGTPTLVDFVLLPLIDRIDDLGMSFLWADHPPVQDWLDRMRSRPSYIKAFYKGSRLSERLEFKLAFSLAQTKRQRFKSAMSGA
ncbi:MAG: glutathione S-transferase family protein [Halioglobus sp.]